MSLSAQLSQLFEQERAYFNQLYADAQWQFPQLESAQFKAFLLAAVDPLVAAVSACSHPLDRDWVATVYSAALELVSHKLAGPAAVQPWYNQLWEQLTTIPDLLWQAPELGAELSNCLHHVVLHPGGQPHHWLATIGRCSPWCQSSAQLRQVAQIGAWTAGLAHYRHSALNSLNQLDQQLWQHLFDLPPQAYPGGELLQQLHSNPWFLPGANEPPSASSISQCGAFSGFGGEFIQPPRVACATDQLFVISDQGCWQLYADSFGTSLQAAPRPAGLQLAISYPPEVTFADQQLRTPRGSLSLESYGEITSACCCHQTLALTTSLSHALLLVPLS